MNVEAVARMPLMKYGERALISGIAPSGLYRIRTSSHNLEAINQALQPTSVRPLSSLLGRCSLILGATGAQSPSPVKEAHLGQWPVPEHRLAIDVLFGNQAPGTTVIGLISVVAHDKIVMGLDEGIGVSPWEASVVRGQVRLVNRLIVYEELALVINPDGLARQANYAFD